MSQHRSSPLETGEIYSETDIYINNEYPLMEIHTSILSPISDENDGFLSIKPPQINRQNTPQKTSNSNFSKDRKPQHKPTHSNKSNPPKIELSITSKKTKRAEPTLTILDQSEADIDSFNRKVSRAKQIRFERRGCLRELSSSGTSDDEPVEPQKIETKPVSDPKNEICEQEMFPAKIDDIIDITDDSIQLPSYFPAIQGCRFVDEYSHLSRVEEGSYGVVFQARDKTTGDLVALKRLKMENEHDGFPITSLREVSTLLKAPHENIVRVREIVVGSHIDRIYVVMDFVQSDLKSLIEARKLPFRIGEVKCILKQLLTAVAHLHSNWILHRDIKSSNILISESGVVKLGDFGSAREYGSPLKNYTPLIVTLWYRAPELLLGTKKYSTKVDTWSVGCVFAELLLMEPLWTPRTEISQLYAIFKELGSPNEKIWPGFSELEGVKRINIPTYPYNSLRNRFGSFLSDNGFNLLNSFFRYSPERRISARLALKEEYFTDEPRPVDPSMMNMERSISDRFKPFVGGKHP